MTDTFNWSPMSDWGEIRMVERIADNVWAWEYVIPVECGVCGNECVGTWWAEVKEKMRPVCPSCQELVNSDWWDLVCLAREVDRE